MPSCSVKYCSNWSGKTKNENIKYFRFPKDPEIANKWIEACNNDNLNLKNARVCSVHFTQDCFEKKPEHLIVPGDVNIFKLSKNAIPTEKLNINEEQLTKRKRKKVNVLMDNVQNNEPACKIIKGNMIKSVFLPSSTSVLRNKANESPLNELMLHQDTRCNANCSSDGVIQSSQNCNLNFTRSKESDTSLLNGILLESNAGVTDSSAVDTTRDLLQRGFHTDELEAENNNLKIKNEGFKLENNRLKQEVQKLNKKLRLQEKLAQKQLKNKVYEILKPVFTTGQIHKLLHPEKRRIKWKCEDIASAIALRNVSPKCYRYLRKKKMPLPGLCTLRKRASTVDISPGVLEAVLSIMKDKNEEVPEIDKLCVLSFDKVYISEEIEIVRKTEKTIGPHKTVQFGMVQGLFKCWKQPIFYMYDEVLTVEAVNEILQKLYDAGYTVVAVTTDLGPSNTAVWNALNIGITDDKNCYFAHPSNNDLKVFVFADPPHLLKLIRNKFIDSGFYYKEQFLNKDCLEELLLLNKSDLRIPYKLEQKHLDATGTECQKVSLAAQVFSNTTAEAVKWFGLNSFLSCENWEECASFFKATNEWFDLFNSKIKCGKTVASSAYGVDLRKQNKILNTMTSYMQNIRVGNHTNLLPFQRSIILSNTSLQGLLPYLQSQYNRNNFPIQYIFTNRINQDVIENFFSYIKGMGAGLDKLSALQFMYRLRWYILGCHSSDMFIEQCNIEEDVDSTLLDAANAVNTSQQEGETVIIYY